MAVELKERKSKGEDGIKIRNGQANVRSVSKYFPSQDHSWGNFF